MKMEVINLLDSGGIKYRLLPHTKPVYTCEEAAKERNVPLSEMIKCILLKDRKDSFYLACIPADKLLDTNKLRAFLKSSRLSFATEQEIEKTLGYAMGSIPPMLLNSDVPVIFHSDIMKKDKVNISSGDPTHGIELTPADLIQLVKPKLSHIAK